MRLFRRCSNDSSCKSVVINVLALMTCLLLIFPGIAGKFDPYVDNGGTLVGQYRFLSSKVLRCCAVN